jgi:hypothetical protein
MRYHWLAHHLVQEWFPTLNQSTRNEIISEAVCRAWCTFSVLDYQLMRSCVTAAAKRKGLLPPGAVRRCTTAKTSPTALKQKRPRAAVIRMSDYRKFIF